jgi:2-amino-4-hydroxy-6-hydroxymethyldihydropteridine diphosphokinase
MRCFLGFGSNLNRERNLATGLQALGERLSIVRVSPVYQSSALGFDGAPFFNFCVEVVLDREIAELKKLLKEIEDHCGRDRSAPKYSSRTLDIDILWVGECFGVFDGVPLPRQEVFDNSFVLKPLVDIAPELSHPHKGGIAELWANYEVSKMPITEVQSDFLEARV